MKKFLVITIFLFLTSCDSNKTADQLMAEAKKSLEAGEYQDVKDACTLAFAKDPSLVEAVVLKARAERSLEEHENAMHDLNRALQMDTSSAIAYTERAYLKLTLSDHYGALSDCNKALTFDPKLAVAYKCRARIKSISGNLEGAVSDYTMAICHDRKDPNAYFESGKVKLKLNYVEAACKDLSKAGEMGVMEAYELIKAHCNKASKRDTSKSSPRTLPLEFSFSEDKKSNLKSVGNTWKTHVHGSLRYKAPDKWVETFQEVGNNITYGVRFFDVGKVAEFSVIETPNDLGETDAYNLSDRDIKNVLQNIFSPESVITSIKNTKIGGVHARFAKATAPTSNDTDVTSVNQIAFYGDKMLIIQGIYPSKDEAEFLPIIKEIVNSISFR